MNLCPKALFLTFAVTFFIASGLFGQSKRQLENLQAFAKAYGYVKYFHPSSEGEELDWGWFSVYGAKEVLACQDTEELTGTLNRLFEEIAPTVVFSSEAMPVDRLIALQTPQNQRDFSLTYWQHYGVGKDMTNPSKLYKSVRVNVAQKVENPDGFGGVGAQLDATPYLGKRLRLKGKAKLASGSTGSGHLWMRVDNVDKSPGFFNNMQDSPIKSSNWASYSFEGNVGEKAKSIYVGGFLQGEGAMYLDELELAYQEDGRWIPIPVKNAAFDDSDLAGTNWAFMGGGVEIKTNSQEKTQGLSALEIRSKEARYEHTKALFDKAPALNEFWIKEISPKVWINMPLALYIKGQETYPKSPVSIAELMETGEKTTPTGPEALEFRLGNLINAWNVFQHFYPYFEETGVDWQLVLDESLVDAFGGNQDSHLKELRYLTAKLQDNHVSVFGRKSSFFAPPIRWEWVEKRLLITDVLDSGVGLQVGDQVEEIEGKSPDAYFTEVEAGISAASTGWLNYRAGIESLLGPENSILNIQVNSDRIALVRDANYYQQENERKAGSPLYKFYLNEVVYLDLDRIPMDTIHRLMPRLERSKAIIADLRGYPTGGNHQLISHLLTKPDKDRWMKVDQLIYPDREKPAGSTAEGWNLSPLKPYLGDRKVVFITDGRAVSYAESYMGFIEGYDLATIVGQPTSGTNGNINQFNLPGDYTITFTGMRVIKHDGSKFHGVGILPDVYVGKTIEGVKSGRDEFLEAALKVANQ
jgi:hypothetical protein